MKIKELIDELKRMPQESLVVMSKDAEGNGFSPLFEIEEGWYEKETTWSGKYTNPNSSAEDAVFFWPVN